MLSKKQEKEKFLKITKVITYFIQNNGPTIEEVSKATHISSSSVQRYLNDKNIESLGIELGIYNLKEIIANLLVRNKQEGVIKGGRLSILNNEALKDEKGRFKGSKKRER